MQGSRICAEGAFKHVEKGATLLSFLASKLLFCEQVLVTEPGSMIETGARDMERLASMRILELAVDQRISN
jgi:hypothetical protein